MKTEEVKREKVILSVDAECDGLWGRLFAIGAVLYSEDGKEIRRFCAKSDIVPKDEWVQENVVPCLYDIFVVGGTHELYRSFADFYKRAREQYGATTLWHMGYVVEGYLFRSLVKGGYIGEWDAPYTPIEVSAYLAMAGYAPDSVEEYLEIKGIKIEGEGSRHHPLFDCISAYRAYESLKEELKSF